jgi:hypothetical protein
MIKKYLLNNSINSDNSNESKFKTQAKSYGFPINIGEKGGFKPNSILVYFLVSHFAVMWTHPLIKKLWHLTLSPLSFT